MSLVAAVVAGSAMACGVSSSDSRAHGQADPAAESDPSGEGELAWGHLKDDSLLPTSPQFLINKKVGQPFRICLAEYMLDALPGIESEVVAAASIWGTYVGRDVPIEVVPKALRRAEANETPDALATDYAKTCGEGFDVVVGLSALDDNTVGLTGASYSYFAQPDGSKKIVSFRRYLFLRDYEHSPDEFEGTPSSWVSLAEKTRETVLPDALRARMAKRSTTLFVEKNRHLTLPVLTHEFGHVWGLCDQYESAKNCDAKHSTTHLVAASIMGSSASRERLFLTDDDIEGVRALAQRPGFGHDWKASAETFSKSPEPELRADVELARIEGVRREGDTLKVLYGVATSKPARLAFSIRGTGDRDFIPLTKATEAPDGFDEPVARLAIALRPGSRGPYAVRMELRLTGDDGRDKAPTVVMASEGQ